MSGTKENGSGKAVQEKPVSEPMSAGYRILRRQYFQLLPYQVLLIVINAVNGIVDSICASNVIGKTAMTAIGMFGPFNHFLYAVSMMLVSGAQVLYGRYMGRNQGRELKNVFRVDLAFSILISGVTSVLMILGASMNWTQVLAPDAAERSALNAYFLGQAVGIPGLILGQQLFAFLSMENQNRRTMTATLACIAVNVIMDILFVMVFQMGVFGLALASALSNWAFFLIMAAYYWQGKSELSFSLKGLDWSEAKNIALLGYPGSLSRFVETFRCLIVNALILQYVGSVGLSSFAASNSVMAIFWSLPFGMMAVDRMLFSLSIGEEDRQTTVNIMRVVSRCALPFILCVAALICLLAEPLTRLFFRDPADPVYGMTVMGLRILPFCMPFSVMNQAFSCYAQTMQKKLFATVMPILNGALFVVAFSFLLIPAIKMTGLYIANVLNGLCCLLVAVLFAWAALKRMPKNMTDMLAFPEDFGVDETDYLEFSIWDEREVCTVSKKVQDFCLAKGVDRRRAFFSGLALEEMAGNIAAHGFHADKRRRSMEIRVTHMDGDVMLRIKDDCTAFNPLEQEKMTAPEDTVKNVGLRIVLNNAKEVQYDVGVVLAQGISREMLYKNTLGLNVLRIRI